MIRKSDWDAVHQQMMAEDRERLGEPPTTEEMVAYTRGELSAEDEARVRALLVCYPDLLRGLTQQFPAEDARPGEDGYLSEAELDHRWASMQKRLPRTQESGRVLQFWRLSTAIAAMLAIVFGALLFRAQSALHEPAIASDEQELMPDGRRGSEDRGTTLSGPGDVYVLSLRLMDQRPFDHYLVELREVGASRPKWTSGPLQRTGDDRFRVIVRRAVFKPGKYRLVLYGVDGTRRESLNTYSLTEPAR